MAAVAGTPVRGRGAGRRCGRVRRPAPADPAAGPRKRRVAGLRYPARFGRPVRLSTRILPGRRSRRRPAIARDTSWACGLWAGCARVILARQASRGPGPAGLAGSISAKDPTVSGRRLVRGLPGPVAGFAEHDPGCATVAPAHSSPARSLSLAAPAAGGALAGLAPGLAGYCCSICCPYARPGGRHRSVVRRAAWAGAAGLVCAAKPAYDPGHGARPAAGRLRRSRAGLAWRDDAGFAAAGPAATKDGGLSASDVVSVTVRWQALQPIGRDYTVFFQAIGPDGKVWGQQDTMPGAASDQPADGSPAR